MLNTKRCSRFLAVPLALAAAACGGDGDGGATAATTTAVETTAAPTTATFTSEAPLDAQLPEGVYRTPELTRGQLIATGVAAGFAEEDVAAYLDRDGVERTEIIGLRLAGGGLTLLLQIDGGPEEVGARATYEVVDDHTLIATDPSCGGSTTVQYAFDGAQLTLDVVEDGCARTVGERIAGTVLFESFPFTREEAASTTASTPGTASTYTSTAFVLPFTVTVPGWLPGPATVDEPNFVTWEAPAVDRAVRFLVPVELYPPGSASTTPPPADYLAYLLGQSADGAQFTDITETTVDGRPATIVTATVANSLDGSLGCPEDGMTADDCFGLQPDLTLRIAVIDAGDETLLVWVRDIRGATVEYESFEAMLASLRFDEERAPSTPTTNVPASTPLDGTWTTNFTEAELASWPFLYDTTEVNPANWGQLTFTFDEGRFVMTQENSEKTSSSEGTFGVEGDTLTLDLDNTERFVIRWSVDGDTLTFERDDSLGVGPTPLVIKPWTRQP